MQVQRIRLEGPRTDPPRNYRRLVLEVDAVPRNGTAVGPHLAPHGVSRVEVYENQLPEILSRCRIQNDLEVYAKAVELCEYNSREWMNENAKRLLREGAKRTADGEWLPVEQWDKEARNYYRLTCNLNPEMYVGMIPGGKKTGIPPLASVKVVSRDEKRTIDARKWEKLSEKEREEWMLDPPVTPQNAAMIAGEKQAAANAVLADVIAKALARK